MRCVDCDIDLGPATNKDNFARCSPCFRKAFPPFVNSHERIQELLEHNTYALALVSTSLTKALADSAQALAIARSVRITSPEVLDWAGGATKHAKDWIDFLDGEREKLTKPLLEEKRLADDAYMPAIKNWRETERVLKAGVGEYHLAQRREQERVMRESAQVYQAGGIPTAPVPVVVSTEGVGIRERWDFEIVDARLVPHELCSPDTYKIEAARGMYMGDTGTEPPPIPGVRFFKTANVRVTR